MPGVAPPNGLGAVQNFLPKIESLGSQVGYGAGLACGFAVGKVVGCSKDSRR